LLFEAVLPPFGYEQFRVIKGSPATIASPAKAEGNVLENEFYKLTFFRTGRSVSMTNRWARIFSRKAKADVVQS
jgi:hypothetical protein